MSHHGFIRVAAAVPRVRVADCFANAQRILTLLAAAEGQGADIVVFPELCLTGYTCGDLFQQPTLQRGAGDALQQVVTKGAELFSGLAIVGLPVAVDDQLFNAAVVFQKGQILGAIPKSYLPNYKEFYEERWFAPGMRARSKSVFLAGSEVPFGVDLLFDGSGSLPHLVLGVEICEDLWVPVPPSSLQALAGATLLVNLSASNEVIGKAPYRRQLVTSQSGRCIAGYVYTSCGAGESTTDVVFGGHCLIAENGILLSESTRFQGDDQLLVTDLDLERLHSDRQRTSSFGEGQCFARLTPWRRIPFTLETPAQPRRLVRPIDAHPFVPSGTEQLNERCEEIFHTQVGGLAKRLEHIGKPGVSIGISGGLDSTLALLVTCRTFDQLGVPRTNIRALTMPGFGTTRRTRDNAHALMRYLGVGPREIDIRALCLEEMRALDHRPFGIPLAGLTPDELTARLQKLPAGGQDLVFENVQARMRTSVLMNSGFVVGTGDLSELALGWCTYNGDHMSMYNPNISIPKTLVKFLVRWAAENEFAEDARKTLLDIVATDISPELLPTGADGKTGHSTEDVIGPYELHDFFLFHFLRYGAPPEKILFLAEHAAFDRHYQPEEIRRWLRVFVQRFFANQFKRSCLPDGPKVGTISLSPRGDWRMPSDAAAALWMAWAETGRD